MAHPGNTLKTGVKELYMTGLFSDLTIKAGDSEFPVHKVIIYTQSEYFQKLLTGGFKEAKENVDVITLPEDDEIIQALVEHLYQRPWYEPDSDDIPRAVFCVQVYQVADKYDVPSLRHLAASRFRTACSSPLTNVPTFVEAIYAVDECTNPKDRTLWDIVMPIIKDDMVELLKHEEFKTLIKEKENLTIELLGSMSVERNAEEVEAGGLHEMHGGRVLGRPRRAPYPSTDGW